MIHPPKMKFVATMLLTLTLLVAPVAIKAQNVESELRRVAYNAEFAVLSVWYNQSGESITMEVVGTAFLVTSDGYFITAAHVLEVQTQFGSNDRWIAPAKWGWEWNLVRHR